MAKALGGVLGALVLLLGGVAYYFLATYEDPPVDPAWAVPASVEVPAGALTVRWTGTSTLVFSDGETTFVVDGWFSRPGPLALFMGEIGPDQEAIDAGLVRNEVMRAAAVFPVHSHYDHAMDAPAVAQRTGAILMGGESTANIGRGWGLPEDQIRVVRDREEITLGRFVVTPIESRHFEFPDPAVREMALGDPRITEPLVPPVETFAYKVGKAYVLLLTHPQGRMLIQGSAGFVEGDLEGIDVDAVFIGVGGLGTQTPAYREAYWHETVGRTSPSLLIPIHWDGLTAPTEGPFRGSVRIQTFLAAGGDQTLAFLKEKERMHPELRFMTLPRYEPVVLFPERAP